MTTAVTLGRTGLAVSPIGLGGLFTSALGPGFEESRRAVQRALDLGVTYIDTAPGYADSEAVLGKILRDVRTPVVLSTKLGGRPRPFDAQNAAQLRQSVETSLQLLGREVIDILFIHEPDRPQQYAWWTDARRCQGPVVEVLDDLKRRGVIRFTGLGGTTVSELSHLVRSGQFDVVLTAFNFSALFREAEDELLPAARERNLGVLLGSVLQQGALGRRYDDVLRSEPKPAWLSEARRRQFLDLYRLVDESGLSLVELCLRFAISRPRVTNGACVLIGAKTAEQVEQSLQAADRGPLPDDLLEELGALAAQLPRRPFEEPMILPFQRPWDYTGPGLANIAAGAPVGKL